ncbi:MAG TPA: alkaline phosphatase D family protein [Gemmataceae bacterium]
MSPSRHSFALAALLLALAPHAAPAQDAKPLARIAFGSCAKEDREQPVWDAIVAAGPDLFLFLGDNIYADTYDIGVMRAKYRRLAAIPGYQKLLKTCPVLATWDDHDYGWNDAGAEYKLKKESQKEFLDFFGVPEDSPRRKREGVYHAETFGPPGKRVQVILLDTRYHRSALKKKAKTVRGVGPYVPNDEPGVTMLGEEQWKWLGEQLRRPAEVRLIGSSIQVVPEDHGWEKWMNLPAERERLFKLIRDTKAAGVIFLSGDRHLAEISMMDGGVGYPLYDVTSSGLNQAAKAWRPVEVNRHRIATMGHGDNFGLITIDWQQENPLIELQIRDVGGEVMLRQRVPLSVLKPGTFATREVIEGVLTPAQAAEHPNAVCTVRMAVRSVGKSRDGRYVYLNSEPNFRDKANFTVVLVAEGLKAALPDLSPESFLGKTVRATGRVTPSDYGPRLYVEEAKNLMVQGEKDG